MGARADLAAAFLEALELAGVDDVLVYAEPADVVAIPCVVVDAAPDYISPMTYAGGGPGAYEWSFLIHLVAVRTDVSSAFDLIELIRSALITGANSLGATVGSLTAPDTVIVNDIPTLQSDLEVRWLTERKT
jgi:hypothetical protein